VNAHLAIITQPRASSGLGGYISDALVRQGYTVHVLDALASKPYKLWPALQSLRVNRQAMWKARWENMLFSSRAWRRNSRRNARLLARVRRPDTRVLVVAKEYFPHEVGNSSEYDVFILYTMKLALADGITPWLPPVRDRFAFLELETELYQKARRIFTGGAYVKPHLVTEYGVAPDRVVVAGGGVHPYFLERAVEQVPEKFTNNLVFVGWDFGMKGGADLLHAFRLAHQQRPELNLKIAGPDVSQWVQQEGVEWLGPIASKDQLIDLYRRSDLFVMPSLRDSFGYVFLEAMTQGVPCIGTDFNAMPEIIQHGKTGYVIPLNNPESLANAILAYYADPSHRREMGRAALERVKNHYTWDLVAERIMTHSPALP
jgi:glycosyltransferase involved in cell wall biosynthesis